MTGGRARCSVRACVLSAGTARLRLGLRPARPVPAPGGRSCASVSPASTAAPTGDLPRVPRLSRHARSRVGGRVLSSPDPALHGARVVGEINFGCGTCALCRDGLARHCPTRRSGHRRRRRRFADLLALPAGALHRVPDDVPDRSAVLPSRSRPRSRSSSSSATSPATRAPWCWRRQARAPGRTGARGIRRPRHARRPSRRQALDVARRLGLATGPPDPGPTWSSTRPGHPALSGKRSRSCVRAARWC
jgi:hypothetical protein